MQEWSCSPISQCCIDEYKKAEIQDKFDSASLLLYRRSDIE